MRLKLNLNKRQQGGSLLDHLFTDVSIQPKIIDIGALQDKSDNKIVTAEFQIEFKLKKSSGKTSKVWFCKVTQTLLQRGNWKLS